MQPRELEALRDALRADGAIVLAYVFGSVARGEDSDGSDVDVAVLADSSLELNELGVLSEKLARAISFNRRVDVVDLRVAPPLLAAEVVRDGVELVARSPEARFDFQMRAIQQYEDTQWLRRMQQDLLREMARGRS